MSAAEKDLVSHVLQISMQDKTASSVSPAFSASSTSSVSSASSAFSVSTVKTESKEQKEQKETVEEANNEEGDTYIVHTTFPTGKIRKEPINAKHGLQVAIQYLKGSMKILILELNCTIKNTDKALFEEFLDALHHSSVVHFYWQGESDLNILPDLLAIERLKTVSLISKETDFFDLTVNSSEVGQSLSQQVSDLSSQEGTVHALNHVSEQATTLDQGTTPEHTTTLNHSIASLSQSLSLSQSSSSSASSTASALAATSFAMQSANALKSSSIETLHLNCVTQKSAILALDTLRQHPTLRYLQLFLHFDAGQPYPQDLEAG